MPKDSKKMAAARSRSQESVKKGKATAKARAVRRAVGEERSERQTRRRRRQQKGKAGR
jgi:hypothetical protein